TVVNDRRDVPAPPKEVAYRPYLCDYDGHFHNRTDRALSVPRPQRARGVNSMDEVPDSTWFTNRIGVRELTPAEIRTGPLTIASPEHHKPWRILSSKRGGDTIGFVIEDTRGERFLIKFDSPRFPEIETAAHVI